jgi:3'-phosphoadenosine 5'-phosphosulfate sulfotransferase (PAPS reductase)/FAD synthetase
MRAVVRRAGNRLPVTSMKRRTFRHRSAPPGRDAVQHHRRNLSNIAALTHLQRLEAESIDILRESVSEGERPVMLYSIGKDSSVMLHLATKAFYPSKPPFPLLRVDTTWKFREMYEFRDLRAREVGMQLIVRSIPRRSSAESIPSCTARQSVRDGTLIMVDDDRMPLHAGEQPTLKNVRFRTLGCYRLTGAMESEADTLTAIIQEMLLATTSERQGRVIDFDSTAPMEKKKQEGYF